MSTKNIVRGFFKREITFTILVASYPKFLSFSFIASIGVRNADFSAILYNFNLLVADMHGNQH